MQGNIPENLKAPQTRSYKLPLKYELLEVTIRPHYSMTTRIQASPVTNDTYMLTQFVMKPSFFDYTDHLILS